MKKKLVVTFSMLFALSSLMMGCGSSADKVVTKSDKKIEEKAEADGSLKTGLALSTGISESKEAGKKEDGMAQTDVMMAAVTVDEAGKIISCAIDSLQVGINFNQKGKLTTELETAYQTKQELGEKYGMKQASPVGKEWNEQADAFAEYCVGKTAEEVTNMAVTKEGKLADAEIASSCTVYPGGFQAIVAKAVENAKSSDAQPEDKIGLGVLVSVGNSVDASKKEDGAAQTDITVAAVTTGKEEKITSAVIDSVQAKVSFDKSGKITADLQAECLSKNELGENYGMKAASSIGKEWNEQAQAYADYAVGKTAEEVNGTAVSEGVPSDADLASSVTVYIGDFNTVLTKAVDNAK